VDDLAVPSSELRWRIEAISPKRFWAIHSTDSSSFQKAATPEQSPFWRSFASRAAHLSGSELIGKSFSFGLLKETGASIVGIWQKGVFQA